MKQYYVYCCGLYCPINPLRAYEYDFILKEEERTLLCKSKYGGAHYAFTFLDDLPIEPFDIVYYEDTIDSLGKVFSLNIGIEKHYI